MKIDKKLIERTIYIILIINILFSIIVSSVILSFKGSEKNIIFSFENDLEFVLAVFLGFIIFYPLSFIVIYLVVFTIEIIVRILKKDGPAEI